MYFSSTVYVMAVAKLRPMLEPRLPSPLTWEDVKPALCLVDSVQELRDAAKDPEAFLAKLLEEAAGTRRATMRAMCSAPPGRDLTLGSDALEAAPTECRTRAKRPSIPGSLATPHKQV